MKPRTRNTGKVPTKSPYLKGVHSFLATYVEYHKSVPSAVPHHSLRHLTCSVVSQVLHSNAWDKMTGGNPWTFAMLSTAVAVIRARSRRNACGGLVA